MSKQQKCKICRFIGYPETVRRENFLENFFAWLDDVWATYDLSSMVKPLSYGNWDKRSTKKDIRCPNCKAIGSMEPVDLPIPKIGEPFK